MTSLVQGGTGIRERKMLVEKQQTLDQGHWYPSYLVNLIMLGNGIQVHTTPYCRWNQNKQGENSWVDRGTPAKLRFESGKKNIFLLLSLET